MPETVLRSAHAAEPRTAGKGGPRLVPCTPQRARACSRRRTARAGGGPGPLRGQRPGYVYETVPCAPELGSRNAPVSPRPRRTRPAATMVIDFRIGANDYAPSIVPHEPAETTADDSAGRDHHRGHHDHGAGDDGDHGRRDDRCDHRDGPPWRRFRPSRSRPPRFGSDRCATRSYARPSSEGLRASASARGSGRRSYCPGERRSPRIERIRAGEPAGCCSSEPKGEIPGHRPGTDRCHKRGGGRPDSGRERH